MRWEVSFRRPLVHSDIATWVIPDYIRPETLRKSLDLRSGLRLPAKAPAAISRSRLKATPHSWMEPRLPRIPRRQLSLILDRAASDPATLDPTILHPRLIPIRRW